MEIDDRERNREGERQLYFLWRTPAKTNIQ
jgi:hypothetical protein